MSLAAGTRIGPYEVVSPLGAGGMGEVYRARDAKLNRDVALKILPDTFAANPVRLAWFAREAQTLAALNHPNIAQIYAVDDRAIVMELVEGEDLSRLIARGPVPLDEALPIARQIAQALEAAHEQGIVHRDLKPANVKVRADGTVKVLDFGLAKALDGPGGATVGDADSPTMMSPAMTVRGVILGTAAYMSPEQARGKLVDRRADIWAWGCVLFEMLAGRPPFEGDNVTEILAKVIECEPDFSRLPATTTPSVSRVIRHCLEKDPRKRLQHIGDARLELDDPSVVPSNPRLTVRRPSLAVRALPWAIAAMALAAAATAPWWGPAPPAAPELLQLEIAYPAGMEGVLTTTPLAISPDGRRVAMVGNRQGVRTLVVRNVDGLDAREVPTSIGTVNNVVFSPDGKSLGIVTTIGEVLQSQPSENQVKSVSRGADLVAGLFWSERGMVFGRDGALWVVPSGGGEARQLTTLDPSRGEVQHGAPFVLDDRVVLFGSFTGDGGDARIEAVPLDGGARTVVIEHASTPLVSPTGHLLFGRDGALMAAPFNGREVRVTGAAFVVIPPGSIRTSSLGGLALALSPSGSLARAGVDFGYQQVMSVNRDGTAQRLSVTPSTFLNPRMSKDGRRLLLEDRGTLVQSFDRARGTLTPLAPAAFGTTFVLWTHDESRVVARIGGVPSWLAADGSGRSGRIVDTTANDWPSGAGPDPDTVLMTRVRPDTGADVYLVSIDGAFTPRPLVRSRAFDGGATLSPDGRWLLYQSTESGRAEVYLRRYPALDRAWQVSISGGVQARWHPSGTEIYYRIGERMMGVSVDLSSATPVLQKAAVLFEEPYSYGTGVSQPNYDVTPDGQFVMLRPVTGSSRVFVTLNWIEELKKMLGSSPPSR